jgi:pentose-5-phosphate-3-epimerase
MPFLPSLLEYTTQALEDKLQLVKNHLTEFEAIQKTPDDKICLHLDFVLSEFAMSRNVKPGNDPAVVFGLIQKYFRDQQIVCNCHFMGSAKDTAEVLEFFKAYNWNPNWEYILYVGQEFVQEFEKQLKLPLAKGLAAKLTGVTVKIGAWLDLDQYNLDTKFVFQDYLLMTVFAGKSGQKLTEVVRINTLEAIQNNPDVNFTIDGGWAVTDELNKLNFEQKNKLNIVSYSSFWKEFVNIIAK